MASVRRLAGSVRQFRPCTSPALLTRASRPILTSSFLAVKQAASFKTMASLKSSDVSPAAHKGYDSEIVDMAKYIHGYNIDSELAVSNIAYMSLLVHSIDFFLPVRHCPSRLPRHSRLRSESSRISILHQTPRPCCPRHKRPQWCKSSWYFLCPRPCSRRFQHWCHDSLARFQ